MVSTINKQNILLIMCLLHHVYLPNSILTTYKGFEGVLAAPTEPKSDPNAT